MVKSAIRLLQVNPGFNPEKLLLMSVTATGKKYEAPEAAAAFQQQLLERAAAVPGVRGVAAIDVVPLTGGNTSAGYAAGRPIPPPDEMTEFNYRTTSDNYFQVMEIPLLQGRHFSQCRTIPNHPASSSSTKRWLDECSRSVRHRPAHCFVRLGS